VALSRVQPAGKAGFRDRAEVKASQWISAWDGHSDFDIGLLAAPLSKTSISHSGAAQFPYSVRAALASYGTYHMDLDLDLSERLVAADLGDIEMHVTDLLQCHANVRSALTSYWETVTRGTLFLVGGDHSISAPSLQALRAVNPKQPIGVIHFDAHHDMRNLEDGGPTNGTPFRTLLEQNVIEGHRMVQIGLRNFSNAKPYTGFAKEHGVTLFTARRLAELGIHDVLRSAWEIASRDGALVYVSFDLDVLDQAFAPGVPAPGPGGMSVWDAFYAMETLGREQQVVAFDWVCADPTVDVRNLTSRVAANLLLYAASGIAVRGSSI
jgi:formiminoglutamase